jgi:hypothetical protein
MDNFEANKIVENNIPFFAIAIEYAPKPLCGGGGGEVDWA